LAQQVIDGVSDVAENHERNKGNQEQYENGLAEAPQYDQEHSANVDRTLANL